MSLTKVIEFSIKDLFEAGVHYGHSKRNWNPKMARYIYGARNGIHIIDLQQTAPMLNKALGILKQVASKNGRILFVGTKSQASEAIAEAAQKCGQYYVNFRWLGGMMTNWPTISASIKKMASYEEMLSNQELDLTKKERLGIERKCFKLERVLGGIRNLGGKPDLLFVIDSRNESLAIAEARKLGVPVVSIVDTNCDPDDIDYVIPGNDDARKAVELYCNLAAEAILSGIKESLVEAGVDLSSMDMEEVIKLNREEKAEEEEKPKKKAIKKAKADEEQAIAETGEENKVEEIVEVVEETLPEPKQALEQEEEKK